MRNEFLRHTLSTIDYRFRKSVINVADEFGNFSAGMGSRTPKQIINHMYHVLSVTHIFILQEKYNAKAPQKLELRLEIDRFISELKKLDELFAEKELDIDYTKKLLQGPLSDILTHIGQISMLQRLNGNSIEGENFASVAIKTGIV